MSWSARLARRSGRWASRTPRPGRSLVLGLAMSISAAAAASAARQPSPEPGLLTASDPVRTRGGLLTGTASRRPGVRAYLGIPFAAPPVGEARWRPPRPAAVWRGVRAADRFSAACMQPVTGAFGPWTAEFLLRGPVSEDCLYLNVWTAARRGERRPVLVFVHGGAFTGGSGDVPVYDGASLADRGLVVVTFNYRLGALGFLAHPALTAESGDRSSGNYGLFDQMAALRWVRDNIAAFGGDPGRVTVAGQSAGASSVVLLTASPMATGLFQRAVVESGPGGLAALGVPTTRALARPLAEAERDGVRFAAARGATSLAALRALPANALVAPAPGTPPVRFGPVVDGRFLPEAVPAIVAAGRLNDVPTLTGMNADEGSASPTYGRTTAEAYRRGVAARYGSHAAAYLARYPAGSDAEAQRSEKAAARDVGLASLREVLAERARTARTPAYMYYFDRAIPWPEHPEFGAFHTAEVPYVFGTLDVLARPWTAADRRLSETMMAYWANFAARGDPNGPGLPRWRAFDPRRAVVMQLGADSVGPRPAPDSAGRALLTP